MAEERITYRPPERTAARLRQSAEANHNSLNTEITRLVEIGLASQGADYSAATADAIDLLKGQLEEKDRQLAAKDDQIAALIDRSQGMAAAVAALGSATEAMTSVASQAQHLHAIDLQRQLPEETGQQHEEDQHERRSLLARVFNR